MKIFLLKELTGMTVQNIIQEEELNIGLDSIVFIDDSDFEINNIRERLPEVETISNGCKIYQYPNIFRECVAL